jgi:hypothetical protein
MALPAVTPVTVPVVLTVAVVLALLLHTPPDAVSVRVMALPSQTERKPAIVPATGCGFTVTVRVARAVPQPLVTVYDILAVPATNAVITPVVLIVATAVLLLLHVPPVAVLENEVVSPAHTVAVPESVPATGNGLTVTICVSVAVPQLLVTE